MRPKAFLLNLSDPERSLDDPGLRALVEAGWTCAGSWPVVRNDASGGPEQVQLMLLLWPPRSELPRSESELLRAEALAYRPTPGPVLAAVYAYAVPVLIVFSLVVWLWWTWTAPVGVVP